MALGHVTKIMINPVGHHQEMALGRAVITGNLIKGVLGYLYLGGFTFDQ